MKRYFLFFSAAVFFAACDVRRNDRLSDDAAIKTDRERKELVHVKEAAMKDSTTVELLDSVYNFGTITEGELVEFKFRFKNTGSKALVIDQASATCGCTVPEKPEKPVMPGEAGFIKVVFNTRHKTGHQEKVVSVVSNARPEFRGMKLVGEVKTP